MGTVRGRVGALVALGAAAAVLLAVASPAQAAAYRYWTYWQGVDGAWRFATVGPASAVPADGAVEGWAFRVSGAAGDPDADPAAAPDFDAVCGSTPPAEDSKRVALVIDPGSPAIAPAGQAPPEPIEVCVVAEPDATGYDVLRSVTQVRVEGGLVCGVAGYPTGECAPVLDDAEVAALSTAASASAPATAAAGSPASPAPTSDASDATDAGSADPSGPPAAGSPIATVVVGLALVALAAWLWRRSRSRSRS